MNCDLGVGVQEYGRCWVVIGMFGMGKFLGEEEGYIVDLDIYYVGKLKGYNVVWQVQ